MTGANSDRHAAFLFTPYLSSPIPFEEAIIERHEEHYLPCRVQTKLKDKKCHKSKFRA